MAGSVAKHLGKIIPKQSILFLCDMQQRLGPTIQYFPEIVQISHRVLQAANLVGIPVIATEQHPKGLGPTVPELGLETYNIKPIPKTLFSMLTPEVKGIMKKEHPQVDSVLLCGIEAHVCIYGTVLDLLENGYNVHVIADGVSSRNLVDRKFAFQRMKSAGAFLTTSECAMFAMIADAKHPKFKDLQKLIMNVGPDSRLLEM